MQETDTHLEEDDKVGGGDEDEVATVDDGDEVFEVEEVSVAEDEAVVSDVNVEDEDASGDDVEEATLGIDEEVVPGRDVAVEVSDDETVMDDGLDVESWVGEGDGDPETTDVAEPVVDAVEIEYASCFGCQGRRWHVVRRGQDDGKERR